jgi:hypothetical protein
VKDNPDDHPIPGAPFFLDGDRMIVALGNPAVAADTPSNATPAPASPQATKIGAPGNGSTSPGSKTGEERMFVIDAAGQQTYLTSRYYDEHTAEFAGQKMQLFTLPGLQSSAPQPAFVAETIPLAVGPTTVTIHFIQVLTQPLGSAALDDVYGVLGLDALDQLQAYTFDYRTMRFSVKPE